MEGLEHAGPSTGTTRYAVHVQDRFLLDEALRRLRTDRTGPLLTDGTGSFAEPDEVAQVAPIVVNHGAFGPAKHLFNMNGDDL